MNLSDEFESLNKKLLIIYENIENIWNNLVKNIITSVIFE